MQGVEKLCVEKLWEVGWEVGSKCGKWSDHCIEREEFLYK